MGVPHLLFITLSTRRVTSILANHNTQRPRLIGRGRLPKLSAKGTIQNGIVSARKNPRDTVQIATIRSNNPILKLSVNLWCFAYANFIMFPSIIA